MRSKWTRPKVEIEIRKLKRAGSPLNVRAMKTRPLYSHARRLFGSWGKAIQSAGIDYDKVRRYRAWTKAIILDWIRRQSKPGRDLRPGTMKDEEAALYTAACRRFGGWYPALRAAGIRGVKEVKLRHWDKEKLIDALRGFGPEATYTEIKGKDPALLSAIAGHFGPFSRARKAAGFVPKLPRRRRLWPKERILETIRSMAKDHPRLRTRDFSDLGGMWAAAMEIFGSWPSAVRAAGFSYVKSFPRAPYKWSKEKITQKLQALDRLGKPLRVSLFERGFVEAARKRFGSWAEALLAAGLTPPGREVKWSPQRIIATLRARAKAGVCPRHARVSGSGIYNAARSVFGSWEGAARAAGLKPAPRAWKWPRERILAEVRRLTESGLRLTKNVGFYTSLLRAFGGVKAAKKAAGVLEP